jgi:hypothetical protein
VRNSAKSDNNNANDASKSSSSSESSANQKIGGSGGAAATNSEKKFSTVNIKLIPKLNRKKIDYTQSYTANNFITTVRAFNEFLLHPKLVIFSYAVLIDFI